MQVVGSIGLNADEGFRCAQGFDAAEDDHYGLVGPCRRGSLSGSSVLGPGGEVGGSPDGVSQSTCGKSLIGELTSGLAELGGNRIDRRSAVGDQAECEFLLVGQAVLVRVRSGQFVQTGDGGVAIDPGIVWGGSQDQFDGTGGRVVESVSRWDAGDGGECWSGTGVGRDGVAAG